MNMKMFSLFTSVHVIFDVINMRDFVSMLRIFADGVNGSSMLVWIGFRDGQEN